MRIFISYSSRFRDLCERLRLALEGEGHDVFVDRVELEAGQPFDAKLRNAIERCDLFIFLISPETVAPASYALAELSIAEQRWRHPAGRVLPVMVAPTPKEAIPPYLRAVTILETKGDAVAETAATVRRFSRWPVRRVAILGAFFVVVAALAMAGYWQWRQREEDNRHATTALAAAEQLCASGDHALAWQRFEDAVKQYSDRRDLRTAREDCAMRWLREIRVREGQETFTQVVERILPTLTEARTSATGQRAADIRAHLGWADFLRMREGASGPDPAAHYRRALADDPANVYAHAMWGHYLMVQRRPIAEARQHFEAALAGGRERAYVRGLQLAAMLYFHEAEAEREALRVVSDMRTAGESVDAGVRDSLWSYFYFNLLRKAPRAELLAGLPAKDLLETFLWLYPENEVRPDRQTLWRFYAGVLAEAAGDKAAARSRFERLQADLDREGASGPLRDEVVEAMQRLGGR